MSDPSHRAWRALDTTFAISEKGPSSMSRVARTVIVLACGEGADGIKFPLSQSILIEQYHNRAQCPFASLNGWLQPVAHRPQIELHKRNYQDALAVAIGTLLLDAVHSCLEGGPCLECWGLGCFDLQFCAGCRVTTSTCSAFSNFKGELI